MEYVFIIKKIKKEKGEVLLKDEAGKQISWPQEKTPARLKEGDKIYFNISEEKHKGAKEILNEILNPND